MIKYKISNQKHFSFMKFMHLNNMPRAIKNPLPFYQLVKKKKTITVIIR